MNAIDTNILVYSIDCTEPDKQAKAREVLRRLLESSKTVLLWQVVGEYLNCLRRFAGAGRFPAAEIDDEILDWLDVFPLFLPTQGIIKHSLALTSRYSLSHWDSMLLAACIEAGVETLYSEDLDAETKYDSVRVINPFD